MTMSDDLERIEEMLREIPLRKPPESMDARVLRGPRPRVIPWVALGGAVAAAIVLAAFLLPRPPVGEPLPPQETPGPAEQGFEPVSVEETVSRTSYEGLVIPDEKTPMRVFRRRVLERTWMLDQQSGYTVEMAVPREEIILINAEMY